MSLIATTRREAAPGTLRRTGRRLRSSIGAGLTALVVIASFTSFGIQPAAGAPTDEPGGSSTTGLANLRALTPVMDCSQVIDLDLSKATDGTVTLTSATVITADTPAPYCEVKGTISPANTIVVRLPVDGWTQRYVQTGCGGLCGTANINYGQAAGCPLIADGTVASATTDMGHQGGFDGSWAANNPQAQIDFA